MWSFELPQLPERNWTRGVRGEVERPKWDLRAAKSAASCDLLDSGRPDPQILMTHPPLPIFPLPNNQRLSEKLGNALSVMAEASGYPNAPQELVSAIFE